jgi:selenocysteine lyase/cysteine desulfurase
VVVLQDDHSSPVLEWMTRAADGRFTVDVVPRPGDGDWTAAIIAAIERTGAAPVAVASISSVHWSDGGLVDLDKVGAALRAKGAALLVDFTHGAGVLAMDVRTLDPDFVIFPTYKWLLGRLRARVPLCRQAPPGQDPAGADELRAALRARRAVQLPGRHALSGRRPALRYG